MAETLFKKSSTDESFVWNCNNTLLVDHLLLEVEMTAAALESHLWRSRGVIFLHYHYSKLVPHFLKDLFKRLLRTRGTVWAVSPGTPVSMQRWQNGDSRRITADNSALDLTLRVEVEKLNLTLSTSSGLKGTNRKCQRPLSDPRRFDEALRSHHKRLFMALNIRHLMLIWLNSAPGSYTKNTSCNTYFFWNEVHILYIKWNTGKVSSFKFIFRAFMSLIGG